MCVRARACSTQKSTKELFEIIGAPNVRTFPRYGILKRLGMSAKLIVWLSLKSNLVIKRVSWVRQYINVDVPKLLFTDDCSTLNRLDSRRNRLCLKA